MKERTLSPAVISELKAALAEEGAFQWMALEVCEVVPRNKVTAEAGKIPYVPAAMMLGSSADDGMIGKTDPTTEVDFQLSERDYDTQRIGYSIDQSLRLVQNDDIYAEAEQYHMPAIANKIGYDVDVRLLGEILRGEGVEADSRDVTVFSVDTEGNGWDHEDGNPLDEFEEHLKKIGGSSGTRLILSTDRAQVLQKSPQVTKAFHGNGDGRLGRSQLADFLQDYLSIDDVQIGRNIYQDGEVTASFNAEYQLENVCFLTKKANLALIPFGSPEPDFRQKEDEDENTLKTIGDVQLDICTYDPAHSVAFVDVTEGESA